MTNTVTGRSTNNSKVPVLVSRTSAASAAPVHPSFLLLPRSSSSSRSTNRPDPPARFPKARQSPSRPTLDARTLPSKTPDLSMKALVDHSSSAAPQLPFNRNCGVALLCCTDLYMTCTSARHTCHTYIGPCRGSKGFLESQGAAAASNLPFPGHVCALVNE